MPVAILIGFEYLINSLVGAVIDLYHAYKWCRSFNCDIHILTDINSIKYADNLQTAIDKNLADSDLLTFYDRISSETIACESNEVRFNKIFIQNRQDLLTAINRILKPGVSKLIIYYSGHGIKNSMMMPDRTLLPFLDFKENILNILDPYIEIFWILDCCNPNGFNLPFKLNGNSFSLSSGKIESVTQPILLITSSEANEKSIATKLGSLFSRYLFRILTSLNDDQITIRKKIIPTHKNRNLRRLIGNLASSIRKMHTGYSQTVSIYSSYIIDPVLWMWIGSRKNYDIVTDLTLSTLIIRQSRHSLLRLDNRSSNQNNLETSVNRTIESPGLNPIESSIIPTKSEDTNHKYQSIYSIIPAQYPSFEKEFINPYDLVYPE